jgi:hypothetical protein
VRVVQDSASSPRASWAFSACRFSAAHRQMRVSGGRRAIRRLTVGARRWSQRPTSNPNGGVSTKPRAIQTIDWCFATKSRDRVRSNLARILTERGERASSASFESAEAV